MRAPPAYATTSPSTQQVQASICATKISRNQAPSAERAPSSTVRAISTPKKCRSLSTLSCFARAATMLLVTIKSMFFARIHVHTPYRARKNYTGAVPMCAHRPFASSACRAVLLLAHLPNIQHLAITRITATPTPYNASTPTATTHLKRLSHPRFSTRHLQKRPSPSPAAYVSPSATSYIPTSPRGAPGRSRPLVEALEECLDRTRKLSSKSPVAKAIDYSLKRWRAFTRFLHDAASACPTMRRTSPARIAVAGATGPSAAPTAEVSAQPPSTR